jgi:hypothetical protein
VYDGTLVATLTPANFLLSGFVGSDSATVTQTVGTYASKNVGTAIGVSAALSPSDFAAVGSTVLSNYSLPSLAEGKIGTIQVRPLSTWVGPTNGLWSNVSNWDALPDGANVLAVSIPVGANVVYDAGVGSTTLQSLASAGTLGLSGGNLTVTNSVNTAQFSQTGGALSGAGTLTVTDSFNQTGGTVSMGSKVMVNQAAGNLSMSAVSAPAVQLAAANGNIDFTNVGVVDIQGLNALNGNITVNNTGGIRTTGPVLARSGNVAMTANSPLTIGADGVSASGDITLTATNLTSAGNLTLNGPVVSSGGSVKLTAANNLVQNSAVKAANQILARSGNLMTFGPGATSDGASVVYELGGVPVQAPPDPTLTGVNTLDTGAVLPGDMVVVFLEKTSGGCSESPAGFPCAYWCRQVTKRRQGGGSFQAG